ncbi:hydroxymethylglutaryl-CoA lyase [Auritidibacter sp. NML100628]|uniref:hydroxymethylglutaryl-CoA lyase n=1 Tax=Auritidibacter sp. NML100628 TaxID=2170742 RepID=UPI000D730771|nr:hydroxymethylglutaryl-CoA lyase [Auritidibacter sp. NML100628]PXA75645.1 pyruvate carboxyltransferase [Auritidibacter sp. NML100628]
MAGTLANDWNLPQRARIVDVGLRDGLQAVADPLETTRKVEIADRLVAVGCTELEVCSFAHPKVLPQLADATQLVAELDQLPWRKNVTLRGLAPNLKGAQRAVETSLEEIAVVIPAEDGMALKNQSATTGQLLDQLPEMARVVDQAGKRLIVAVACAYFSPCYGEVTAPMRHRVIRAAVDLGVDKIYLANTTGEEHPGEVYAGLVQARVQYPYVSFGTHLHNRNGAAPANALAALAAGADWLETSVAALGGDMWFPGDPVVLGNMATEDLVHFLESMGIATGLNLEDLRALATDVVGWTGFPPSSFVLRGGTRDDLAQASWD